MIPKEIKFQKANWLPLKLSRQQDLTDYYANSGLGQKIKSIRIFDVNCDPMKRIWSAEFEKLTPNNWYPGMRIQLSGTNKFNSSYTITEVDEIGKKIYFSTNILTAHVQTVETEGYAKPSGVDIESFVEVPPILNHNNQIIYYEYNISGTYYLSVLLSSQQNIAIQVVNTGKEKAIKVTLKCSLNGIDWTTFPNDIKDYTILPESNEIFIIAENMRGYYVKIDVDDPDCATYYAVSSI